MATFHEMDDATARRWCGASSRVRPTSCWPGRRTTSTPTARRRRWRTTTRERVLAENDRLAGEGMRVLAVARRDFDPATFDPGADLLALVAGARAPRAHRHRRPAAQGGEGRDRALPRRRHPRPDDHRRPRHDGGRDRRPARASRAGRSPAPSSRRMPDEQLLAELDEHRRRRPGRPGGQGPPGQHPQAAGQRRRHDRRRRQRRPRADPSRHRRGDGHHRHRGHQGRGRDDPHRRQLRHDRHRGRGWAGALRQPDEVRPRPDDHARRLHPHVRRRRHLRRSPTAPRSCRCRSCGSTSPSTCCSPSDSASTPRRPG